LKISALGPLVVSSLIQHAIYSTWFYNIEKNLLIETFVNPEQNEATEAPPWFINDLVEEWWATMPS
jgi:hypothetical protein